LTRDKSKQSHALMSYYEKLYRLKYDAKPRMNRYSLKWGMIDVIDSVGYDRAKELLDYFFTTPSSHTLEFFYKNFDSMDVFERHMKEDRARRAIILKQTEQRIREARD